MAADGEHTVEEFVSHMASQYDCGELAGLRAQIHAILQTLSDEHVLRIHDAPEPLPPYFAEEYFEADAEMRKQQMQADGLID